MRSCLVLSYFYLWAPESRQCGEVNRVEPAVATPSAVTLCITITITVTEAHFVSLIASKYWGGAATAGLVQGAQESGARSFWTLILTLNLGGRPLLTYKQLGCPWRRCASGSQHPLYLDASFRTTHTQDSRSKVDFTYLISSHPC